MTYDARVSGNTDKAKRKIDEYTTTLKVGSKVMLLVNLDVKAGFVNGSLGYVVAMT